MTKWCIEPYPGPFIETIPSHTVETSHSQLQSMYVYV